jgi:ATP-dependent DNA helicase PIF1
MEFLDSLLNKKQLQTRFSKLKVLIIDEVSMISPAIFTAMDSILKAFKKSPLPFGGVQVILSGDFFNYLLFQEAIKRKDLHGNLPLGKN